jgi:8-oxo-dGTP pyrophosphatase MutT (NUDIX family)
MPVREFSSGGVIYRSKDDETLWFVRKTTASDLYPKQYWMLPKGRIDDSENDTPGPMASGKVKADEKSLQETAIREVREEGGIDAEIVKKIKTIFYSYNDQNRGKVMKFVTFYLMKWLKDLPEGFDWETSEIAWLPFDEAVERLSFDGEKEVLEKATTILSSTL